MKVHDGPYAETREQLGGYYIIEAPIWTEALKWAAQCPAAQWGHDRSPPHRRRSLKSSAENFRFEESKWLSASRHCSIGARCSDANGDPTMRYMMLIHHDDAALAAAPQKELWADYAAFNEALAKAGGRRAPASGCSRAPRQPPCAPPAARPTSSTAPMPTPRSSSPATSSSRSPTSTRPSPGPSAAQLEQYGSIEIRPVHRPATATSDVIVATRRRRAAERVARESYGRLVAFLAARTRDVAGAEDALAEAFAAALASGPTDGVPDNPDAWLLTVARRRQTDALRRRQTRTAGRGASAAHGRRNRSRRRRTRRHPRPPPGADVRLRPSRHRARHARAADPADHPGPHRHRHRRRLPHPAGDHGPAPGARQDAHQGRRHPLPRPRARRNCPSGSMPCSRRSTPPTPRAGARSATRGRPSSPTRPSGSAGWSSRCCPTSPRPRACWR